MTGAPLTTLERPSGAENTQVHEQHHGSGEGLAGKADAASLSAQVWAFARGSFDKGIAAPIDTTLEITGVSNLYKATTGSELRHLAGNIGEFKSESEKVAYAAGAAIGENLPLLAVAAALPPVIRALSRAQLLAGQKMFFTGESVLQSANQLAHGSMVMSELGKSLSGTGNALIHLSSPLFRLSEQKYFLAGASGFGQGFLTAETGEHGWTNRWAAGTFSAGMALAERGLGSYLNQQSGQRIRSLHGPEGITKLTDRHEVVTGGIAGVVIGGTAAALESAIKSGRQAEPEEALGAMLGHGIGGTVLAARARGGMLQSPFYRYIHLIESVPPAYVARVVL